MSRPTWPWGSGTTSESGRTPAAGWASCSRRLDSMAQAVSSRPSSPAGSPAGYAGPGPPAWLCWGPSGRGNGRDWLGRSAAYRRCPATRRVRKGASRGRPEGDLRPGRSLMAPDDSPPPPERPSDTVVLRRLFETRLSQLSADERTRLATQVGEPELQALCFDPLPVVARALVDNPRF